MSSGCSFVSYICVSSKPNSDDSDVDGDGTDNQDDLEIDGDGVLNATDLDDDATVSLTVQIMMMEILTMMEIQIAKTWTMTG